MAKWDVRDAAPHFSLRPPDWVNRRFANVHGVDEFPVSDAITCTIHVARDEMLIRAVASNADDLDPLGFQRQTISAYRAIAEIIQNRQPAHPVRFWNHIPNIGLACNDSLSRYMVFNAGRYAAFLEWYQSFDAFSHMVATASGVGHHGRDLVIHCLCAKAPGIAVENPRQVSSYNYSSRYGPLPPSFARATVLSEPMANETLLLVGGTASICGEQSLHLGDVIRQTGETLQNLAAVIEAGCRACESLKLHTNGTPHPWLQHLQSARVYYVHERDRRSIRNMLEQPFAEVREVEWVQARLCRPELLVEIEGVAVLPPLKSSSRCAPAIAMLGAGHEA